jgi:WD40 repeat protein
MEAEQLSVHVLRCPFGVRQAQFMSGSAETVAGAALPVGDHYARVSSLGAETNGVASQHRHYAVAGTRGIQQLVATTRNAHAAAENGSAGKVHESSSTGTSSRGVHCPHADVFSMHDKGRLLMWHSDSGRLAASHAFNPAFTVHRCVVTAACMYVTLEGSPATAGAEEETCVYVLDRHTLQPVTVLRGHEGRLTALAVAPSTVESTRAATTASEAILATASLDGTVRLWCHRYEVSPRRVDVEKTNVHPVQTLAALPTAELGIVHSLSFLSTEVLVAGCSKCVLAFVRLSDMTAESSSAAGSGAVNGRSGSVGGGGLRWQQMRSSVDPDGSTTTLHVCPLNAADNRKTSSVNNNSSNSTGAPAATVANARSASPNSEARRRKFIITGSTSGYLQEWVVDLGEGEGPSSPNTTTNTAAAGVESPVVLATAVLARGRWHHKAHAATVDCIVTDDDIAVSTSIFDGARLYHRRTGATSVITTAAMVPVLVPPLKQLVWGSADGSLSLASYALFASGAERELQLLWACKPHAAAIRAVSLSLTATLQWRALCIGAADGSVSIWRPAAWVAPPMVASQEKTNTAKPTLNVVLDVYVEPPTRATGAAVGVVAVGLKKEAGGYALAVAEMCAQSDATPASLVVLPLPPSSQQPGGLTCARLCGDVAKHRALCLFVGTRSGELLHYVKASTHSEWRAIGPCKWTATSGKHTACITAISSLQPTGHGGALLAVTSQSSVGESLATQRVSLAVLPTNLEEAGATAAVVVGDCACWEDYVDVPAPSQSSLVSVQSNSIEEAHVRVEWFTSPATQAKPNASTGENDCMIVVRDSRGMLLRSRSVFRNNSHAERKAHGDVDQTWTTPEALARASASSSGTSVGVEPTMGSSSVDIVVAESGESDVVCVNVVSGRKRVLMKAAARQGGTRARLCDAGTTAVRFAASGMSSSGGAATLSDVALYDDEGREQYRVTRDGTVTPCASMSAAAVAGAKKALSFSTDAAKSSSRSSPERSSLSTAACTLLVASAADRLLFVGYDDGLLQMVDMTDMFVFTRVWVRDDVGDLRAVREAHYANGVVVVRLAGGCLRVFVVPPRSILDQPMSAS